MLLAMKDEAGSNLKDEENDFMLDNSYGDETLKELTVVVIMMARIQPANENAESEPSYDAKAVSEVNASNEVHEQVNLVKRKTVIHTSDDDQINFNIILLPSQNKGRQTQGYTCSGGRGNAIGTGVNRNVGTNITNQAKVVCCYNYQDEGHMARQCTKPKRPKNSEWFKEKMLLAQALEARVVLDEEQMAFLADCDEAPSASSILMAKLFAYDSDILLEVPNLDTYQANNNVIDQNTTSTAQQDALIMYVIEEMYNQVAKYNAVNKDNKTVNESLIVELKRNKEQIKIFEERQKFDLTDREKYIDGQMRGVIVDRNAKFDSYQKEIQTLKLQLSANISFE
ncbi:retrovirus-related pol polyprotein from transposon TNT 1-94 [Tanacetum coccineum]